MAVYFGLRLAYNSNVASFSLIDFQPLQILMRSLIFLAEVDIIRGKSGPSRMYSLQLKSRSSELF